MDVHWTDCGDLFHIIYTCGITVLHPKLTKCCMPIVIHQK